MRVSLLTWIPNTTQLTTGIFKARLNWGNIDLNLKYMIVTWAMGQNWAVHTSLQGFSRQSLIRVVQDWFSLVSGQLPRLHFQKLLMITHQWSFSNHNTIRQAMAKKWAMIQSLWHDLCCNLLNGSLLLCCCWKVELRTRHPGHPSARAGELLF